MGWCYEGEGIPFTNLHLQYSVEKHGTAKTIYRGGVK